MPRKARKKSATDIYHVMLRAVNRQQIFYEEEDYQMFLKNTRRILVTLVMQLAGFFFYIDLSQKEENIADHKNAEPTVILRNNRKYAAK